MKKNLKVSIIGGKASGKTCFLMGMYAVMRRGMNNFFLHCADTNDDERLMKSWSLLTRTGDRKWPAPTTEDLARYHFTFKSGLTRTLAEFEWIDYRGSLLHETSDASAQLVAEFNQSDCIFFCADGNELRSPVGDRLFDVDNALCISRAKVLLDGLQKRVPIVVIVTKNDICNSRMKNDLTKDIELLFDAWLAKGEGWGVMICPVTLGVDLNEEMQDAPVNPRSMHLPLIYAIFSMQVESLMAVERDIRRLRESRMACEQRIGALGTNFLSEFLNRQQIEEASRESSYLAQQVVRQDRELRRLKQELAQLGHELSKATMYSNGERVTVAGK